MKILLKQIKLSNREGFWDILIDKSKIKEIDRSIEEKDIDFSFLLKGYMTTPSPVFINREPIDALDGTLFFSVITNGIKSGYTKYLFILKDGDKLYDEKIEEIENIFGKTYVHGIFVTKNHIPYRGRFLTITDTDSINMQKEIIEEGDEASIVIWNTKEFINKINPIPYIVISKGKIILREGETIFL